MDSKLESHEVNYNQILANQRKLREKLAEDLANAFIWDSEKVSKLLKSISQNIYAVLNNNNNYNSLYYDSEWDKRYIIVDNMRSDVIKKIIEDKTSLNYDEETKPFDDNYLKNIMQGITEDATVRTDPESAEEYLRAKKLNKARPGELAGNYKGGKRSKNNKKKSKRKHQHNKKSHKKRR
jgi:hypothetical protein